MAEIQTLDYRGLKCLQPTMKLNTFWMKEKPLPGTMIEVISDCPEFPENIKKWVLSAKTVLMFLKDENDYKRARIQF